MKDNGKLKKTKAKNYFILVLIFVLGVGITLYLSRLYHVYDEYQKETPVIRGVISEITSEELEHYLLENPTCVLYMCTSSDMTCRNFEKDFKKLIKKDNLQDDIVYLNLSDVKEDEFINKFNDTYKYRDKLTANYPALVLFEDGEVRSILQGKKDEKLTIKKTEQFIDLNDLGENYE